MSEEEKKSWGWISENDNRGKGSILIRNDASDNQIARHIFSRESHYVIRRTASLIFDFIFLSNQRINVKYNLINI